VVHRDIKPGNIFLCRRGPEYDFVKVLDFGLVKQIGASGRKSAQLTVEGIASGTPAFMAPEMAYDSRVVDGRADLYALGCVAYWLLTGVRVFEGRTAIDTMLKHVHDAPVPPSQRTELAIPPDLEALVMACLEKDPVRRPQSADWLADALARVPGATDWTPARARDWWATHDPEGAVATVV
jgi:serine/threonine-protein kinase